MKFKHTLMKKKCENDEFGLYWLYFWNGTFKLYHFKIMLIYNLLDLKMLPKLLMNGIKLERVAPTQEQVAQDIPYKVKYPCKFCEMLWLDKLALFFQILAIFLLLNFYSLKTLP